MHRDGEMEAIEGDGHARHFRGPSRASRELAARRVVAAANAERRRLERDLHDGLQQRLTALRIRLAVAAGEFAEGGDPEAGAALDAFGAEVDQAIDELRDLAHGVYPALLDTGGLPAALGSAVRRAPGKVALQLDGVRRYAPDTEAAVYFACLAAMDNAAKHAGDAGVTVQVRDTGETLRFSVSDSGRGFDAATVIPGLGLANMSDRIATVGGSVSIDSAPGRGTRVDAVVPLSPQRGTTGARHPVRHVRMPWPRSSAPDKLAR